MLATYTCNLNELTTFAKTYLNISDSRARMEVKERFFPECESLVVFKHEKYILINQHSDKDDKYGNYDNLAGMIVAFLDFHNIKECLITNPGY